jgi:hypothetical protein
MPESRANDDGGSLCAACLQFLKDAPACSSRRSVGPSEQAPARSPAPLSLGQKARRRAAGEIYGALQTNRVCVSLSLSVSVLCRRERC